MAQIGNVVLPNKLINAFNNDIKQHKLTISESERITQSCKYFLSLLVQKDFRRDNSHVDFINRQALINIFSDKYKSIIEKHLIAPGFITKSDTYIKQVHAKEYSLNPKYTKSSASYKTETLTSSTKLRISKLFVDNKANIELKNQFSNINSIYLDAGSVNQIQKSLLLEINQTEFEDTRKTNFKTKAEYKAKLNKEQTQQMVDNTLLLAITRNHFQFEIKSDSLFSIFSKIPSIYLDCLRNKDGERFKRITVPKSLAKHNFNLMNNNIAKKLSSTTNHSFFTLNNIVFVNETAYDEVNDIINEILHPTTKVDQVNQIQLKLLHEIAYIVEENRRDNQEIKEKLKEIKHELKSNNRSQRKEELLKAFTKTSEEKPLIATTSQVSKYHKRSSWSK